MHMINTKINTKLTSVVFSYDTQQKYGVYAYSTAPKVTALSSTSFQVVTTNAPV